MSFEDLDELLADGREMAEADMTDQCIIRRTLAPGVFDDSTGVRGPATTAVVYPLPGDVGKCRIQFAQIQPDVPTSAEHRYILSAPQVSIPVASPSVLADDEIEIVASQFDPSNVGRKITATVGIRKSHATAYRIQGVEVAG